MTAKGAIVEVVRTFTNPFVAQVAQGRLAEDGIEAIVVSDDVGGMHPELTFTRGVRLLVAPEHAEAARQSLADAEDLLDDEPPS